MLALVSGTAFYVFLRQMPPKKLGHLRGQRPLGPGNKLATGLEPSCWNWPPWCVCGPSCDPRRSRSVARKPGVTRRPSRPLRPARFHGTTDADVTRDKRRRRGLGLCVIADGKGIAMRSRSIEVERQQKSARGHHAQAKDTSVGRSCIFLVIAPVATLFLHRLFQLSQA